MPAKISLINDLLDLSRLDADAEPLELTTLDLNSWLPSIIYPFEERIQRFYRVPTHDPWKHGGTGLGLALVEKQVSQIGGAIELSNSRMDRIQTTDPVEDCLRKGDRSAVTARAVPVPQVS